MKGLHRSLLCALGITVAAAALGGCVDDRPDCERCDFEFYWDSTGQLSGTDETCREISCSVAVCGLCSDITYNENDQPVTGTCDSCIEGVGPECPAPYSYCPTHPDECAAEGVDPDRCGCYALRDDDDHCGACFAACPDGSHCAAGECVE